MKKLFLLCIFVSSLFSCSSQSSEYEKILTDFIEVRNGVRTDLKVEFLSMTVSDLLVQDSINIIQSEYEAEKAKRIAQYEKNIAGINERIAEHKKVNDIAAKAAIRTQEKFLENEKNSLENAKNWHPDILNKYNERNPQEVIANKVICDFSIFDPKLQTRVTYNNALFILSADGKTPLHSRLNNEENK